MRIGQIAREAKVATSAIRYYERIGLLPRAQRMSGRREYEPSILDRLALISFAQACGFRISEVRALLSAETPSRRARDRWRPLAESKLQELGEAEVRLRRMRKLVAETLRCNCLDLAACGARIRATQKRLSKVPRRSPHRQLPLQ